MPGMSDEPFSWPPGAATGLGPFPGTDPYEAARIVFTQLPVLPYLPALPARGAGSDPVGRTAALLVDLHVDLQPSGWRLVPRPGLDERRAASALRTDVDALEEAAQGYEGDVKIGIVGPATLAAHLELAGGEKSVVDPGAVGDVAGALAEGLSRLVAELRKRLPALGRIVVALDEPLLPAVLGGQLPTASGWGRLRALEPRLVEDLLGLVLAAAGPDAGLVCSTPAVPLDLIRRTKARFLGVAGSLLEELPEDELGDALDAGLRLLVGLVPASPAESRPDDLAEPVRRLWGRLGFPLPGLSAAVAVTHLDGLEALAPFDAARVLTVVATTARFVEELSAGEG